MPEYRREQRIKIGCVELRIYAANFNTLFSPILRHVYYFVFHLSGPKFRFVLFGCCFLFPLLTAYYSESLLRRELGPDVDGRKTLVGGRALE